MNFLVSSSSLNRITVHVPLEVEEQHCFQTVVHVGPKILTLELLDTIKTFYKNRLHRVIFQQLPEDTSLFETASEIIFVVPITLDVLLNKRPDLRKWRRARIIFELTPDENLLRLANHLTAEGFPVRIPIAACMKAPDIVRRCLKLYLHHQSLTVPVDPFHSLFSAAYAKRSISFWKIESTDPARDIFVAEDGRKSISESLLEQGFEYGHRNDTLDTALCSIERKQLIDISLHPERYFTPCAECSIRTTCCGYLAFLSQTADCEAWRAVFDEIQKSADKLQSIVTTLKTEENTNG